MRERRIKFRVWDLKQKKWVKPTISFWPSVDSDNYKEMYLEAEDHEGMPGWVIFCQWTGLKDRKGKEIYEGDIVKWFDDLGELETHFEVQFSEGRFILTTQDLPANPWSIRGKTLEVIGNIYSLPTIQRGRQGGTK